MVYNTNTMISICSLKKKNVLCGLNKRFFFNHYRYYYLVIKKFFGVKTSSHKDCRGSSSINTQGSKGREAIYAVTKRGSRLPRQPENFPHKAFRSRYARTYTSRPYTVCFLHCRFYCQKRYPLHCAAEAYDTIHYFLPLVDACMPNSGKGAP